MQNIYKMYILKNILKKSIIHSPLIYLGLFIARNLNPRIFVYHRFCSNSEHSYHKTKASTFKWQLTQIKKRFQVITLGKYLKLRKEKKPIPPNLVILTIDDGYHDFYRYAYPTLKKMCLTATFFVTVEFVEKNIWLWPDRISYIFEKIHERDITFQFDSKKFEMDLTSERKIFEAWKELSDFCISIRNESKWKLLRKIEHDLKVRLPEKPPKRYSSVTWDQLREMRNDGIEIGSHTLNHPILSKVSEKELYQEIHLSKKKIETELNDEVRSFCYPNSYPEDINDRVIEHVKMAGYEGAVFGALPGSFDDIYTIPRLASDVNADNFLWKLYGYEFI